MTWPSRTGLGRFFESWSNGVSSLLRDLLNPEIEEEEALIRPKNGLGEYAKVDPCPSSFSHSFCI